MEKTPTHPHPMAKRMLLMLLIAGLLFGAIFGFQLFKAHMIKKSMASQKPPPVTVTAITAEAQSWQSRLNAVGSLRAVRGVDVTSEIAGLVRTLYFRSGEDVRNGQLLVQLNADADIAQLNSLKAAAELAETVYDRGRAQYAAEAVSKAVLDADAADLKSKRALVAQQQATVEKKAINSPFSGRLGITTVNPGQYLNPGDKIVTLQTIDPIYIDFYMPQQQLARLAVGLPVTVATDSYPGRKFTGRIVAFDPKVDLDTRNIQVEALLANPAKQLLPGMYATASVASGAPQRLLTLPQTAVSFNPYGATVYIVRQTGKTTDGKPILTVKQNFVTTGDTRGDQVAILSGVKAGDVVVTSGQLKLRNGSEVVIDNRVQPSNNAAPKPVDE